MRDPRAGGEGDVHAFETGQPIALALELGQGPVRVIAGDRSETVVAVHPCDPGRPADVEAAARTGVDLVGGILSVRDPRRRRIAGHLGLGRGGCVDVTVEVPEGTTVKADTSFGDVRCVGRLGDVDLRTGAGSVRLDRTGAARIHSGAGHVTLGESSGDVGIVTAGDIEVGTVAGDADIKNLNGTTRMSRIVGGVRVKSANGDVTVDDAGSDVTVTTANGDIRLGRIVRGSTSLETAFGALEMGIAEGTAAWIDANTRFGQIRNGLSPAGDPDEATERVQVRARTAFGDVLISRASS